MLRAKYGNCTCQTTLNSMHTVMVVEYIVEKLAGSETRWGQTELNETQYTITTKRSKTGNMVTPLALDICPQ